MKAISIPKKSLGQHWLEDSATLEKIAGYAEIDKNEIIIEVGPGLGTLTAHLLLNEPRLTAVEFDRDLYQDLISTKGQFASSLDSKNLQVVNEDILKFRFDKLSGDYKVVGNIPYYLTSNLIRVLSETPNPPKKVVLLIQKEVAERLCASAGQMSLLSVWAQLYFECRKGILVPAGHFSPPPKVDSQVVIMDLLPNPKIKPGDIKLLTKILSGAFNSKRKTLQNTLSTGLSISKSDSAEILEKAGLKLSSRPQELSVDDWIKLLKIIQKIN